MLKAKLTLLALSFFFCSFINAQIEGAYFYSKHVSQFGVAGFLNVAIPISDADAITPEIGLYYFGLSSEADHAAVAPIVVGYRHTFNGEGDGLYIEPFAGYSIGATDIPKTDANGSIMYGPNGEIDETVNGICAGAAFGYIFPGNFRFNIGLRVQHVFVFGGDPSASMFSLRLSHSLSFRRRNN